MTTLYGDPVTLGNGFIQSFVTLNSFGQPTTLGVQLNAGAFSGLPDTETDVNGVIPTLLLPSIPLPANVLVPPYTDIEVQYWNEGHQPDLSGVINTLAEHFDFYLFMVSQAERDLIGPNPRVPGETGFTIDGQPGETPFPASGNITVDFTDPDGPTVIYADGDAAKIINWPNGPDPRTIPEGYIQTFPVDQFFAEPRYGTRFFDNDLFENRGPFEPFTEAPFFGYSEGRPTFFEVPVTFFYLDPNSPDAGSDTGLPSLVAEGGIVTVEIGPSEIYLKSGYYPTSYSVTADPNADMYQFVVNNLTFQQATPVTYDFDFNDGDYLEFNTDVAAALAAGAYTSAEDHYARFGQFERRAVFFSGTGNSDVIVASGAVFDEVVYRALNADVNALVRSGVLASGRAHYNAFGFSENRLASLGSFDEQFYLDQHQDVAAAIAADVYMSGAEHYLLYGQQEGRAFNLTGFDAATYLAENADVAAAVATGAYASAIAHFVTVGRFEDRFGSYVNFGGMDITGVRFDFQVGGSGVAASDGFAEIDILIGTGSADVFRLGDATAGVFYHGFGAADYVHVANFQKGVDMLLLGGSSSAYSFDVVSGVGTNILYQGDLVAFLEGFTGPLSFVTQADGTFFAG